MRSVQEAVVVGGLHTGGREEVVAQPAAEGVAARVASWLRKMT